MSAHYTDEPMEVDEGAAGAARAAGRPPPAEGAAGFQHSSMEREDQVPRTSVEKKCVINVSFEAGDSQRSTRTLQEALQSWCKEQTPALTVDNFLIVGGGGSAEFEIHPAPDVDLLQELNGKKLKTSNGETVQITSISASQSEISPINEPAEPQQEIVKPDEQINMESPTEPPGETCVLSVTHYCYLSHAYKDDIARILEDNGVNMETELTVTFKARTKDGSQAKASSEFAKLCQKVLSEATFSTIPLKHLDAQKLMKPLSLAKERDQKLLLAISSQEMTVYGSRQGCEAVSESLPAPQGTNGNKPADLVLNINDPLSRDGLTIEKSCWKQMTLSPRDDIHGIQEKFGVRLQVKDGGDTVSVKALYNRPPGPNPSMESHATRALVRLYQRFVAPREVVSQRRGDAWIPGSNHQGSFNECQVVPSGGQASSSQWGTPRAEAASGVTKEARAGDSEEEKCPICLDSRKNEVQLKCKHKFCKMCLKTAVEALGKICPLCKYVFGVIEGNQPDGKMSEIKDPALSLPGYEIYGTIIITYNIPSGLQTDKHPNPGRRYHGTTRTAYLPDNEEGNEVLQLLKKAFKQKLIFTVGRSVTSGCEDQVTWNDIHHKTRISGGPSSYGYPDPSYLSRVKDELKSKGIV